MHHAQLPVSRAHVRSTDIERANTKSLPAVVDAFVDAFWTAGTNFGKVRLSERERRQLARQVADDFRGRYSSSWEDGNRLFGSRLLLAREPDSGVVVGCVGLESTLLDPLERSVFTAHQAEGLLRAEFATMADSERCAPVVVLTPRTVRLYRPTSLHRWLSGRSARGVTVYYAELFGAEGIAALVGELMPQYSTVALLTNLAVAPAARRSGLAQELCQCCELGCVEWGLPVILLQVEEENAAARSLYQVGGYRELFRQSGMIALRLRPSARMLTSTLLLGERHGLLVETNTTMVTMAKEVHRA
jgi:GNAT superfamily N-acetyltransferase